MKATVASPQTGRPSEHYPIAYVQMRPGPLGHDIRARGNRDSLVVKAMMRRYLLVVERSLRTTEWTTGEAMIMANALRGFTLDAETVDYVPAKVERVMRELHLAEANGVDAHRFVQKLRDLSTSQVVAVVDAVERFWQMNEDDPFRSPDEAAERLVDVGLVRS